MVLLDYPDSEGVTRELAVGYPVRRVTGDSLLSGKHLLARRPWLALVVSAILGLAAILVSQTVFRTAGTGPAPDIHLPVVPFPTVSASPTAGAGTSPPLAGSTAPPTTVSLHGNQVTPSAAPVQNTVTPSATMPATASASAAGTQQVVAVQFLIVAQADGGFQFEGEVRVVNNGSAPISGWQITVALPYDQITAIGGANGYVSNHILLVQPEAQSPPLEPGGELNVFFEAEGPEMTPQLCAFDNTTCG